MLVKADVAKVLRRYIPSASVSKCVYWIIKYNIHLRITRSRASKYGDYRSPLNGSSYHRISINHDLNKYAFLITFVHEVAHLTAWQKFRRLKTPHGAEWKREFRILMEHFFGKRVFPKEVTEALQNYLRNPAASSCTDYELQKVLRKYDPPNTCWIMLDELRTNSVFMIRSGRRFIKGPRLMKNFECIELRSRKKYFVHPTTEVQKVR